MLENTLSQHDDAHRAAIAVVGMSGHFPGADNVDAFWNNIAAGLESVRELSDAELVASGVDAGVLGQRHYVRRHSSLDRAEFFDAGFFDFTAREASMTAPSQRLLLACAYEALEDASCVPGRFKGDIGVFVGANRCDEWQKRLYELSEQVSGQTAKELQFFIANDLDYSASRISYKLNLTGPSMSISTACSTSLVAIVQACRALLSHECDMALAGGSNVVVPQYSGYLHEEGGIRSSDGRCRAFDARADGTVFGNGAGMVALKRLDQALLDRDYIHAVIRGGAINNDGSAKVGYTAPSVTGQARAISAALSIAGVHPESIGYVEAHGTGTALGDPIEIEALSKAYRAKTKKKRYCAIGSVKTNIGHLGSAAGVAGFIKAAQALKSRQIPPSLHFTEPNPEIDFSSSPFFVNTKLQPWAANGAPRRAGVSSFGVGGTNAHVILEEAPPVPASSPSRAQTLMVLSAKSPSALAAMRRNLAARLEGGRALNLADVAYSLNTGRESFQYRDACVAGGIDEAIDVLRRESEPAGNVRDAAEANHGVAFMFPGQGSQHLQMGLGLYQNEKVFRDVVDECAEQLQPWLNRDIRPILFPADRDTESARTLLGQTVIAQPALFVVEYALARLWQSWGVTPERMIGHSIGEYVAACLSGVFSLADALYLVAERGRLMQSMPAGAMLAVSVAESELRPLLGDCELAAVNGPAWCVASGPESAIAELERSLAGRDVSCRRLHTSHAFHSRMMDPILKDFARALQEVRLHPPTIPFFSNVTGELIRNHEATDAMYWVKQLRGTVRFHAGAARLLESRPAVLLEVGPGQTLYALVKTFNVEGAGSVVLASCRQPKQSVDDQAFLLHALGRAWSAGVGVDWSGFYKDEQRNRVPLPTYPFEGRRYWLERRAAPDAGRRAEISAEIQNAADGGVQDTPRDASASGAGLTAQWRACAPGERKILLTQFVRRCVQSLLGTQDVSDDTALIEMGMSSLAAIELRTQINTVMNADLVSVVMLLDESATIQNLAELLNEKLESSAGEFSGDGATPDAARSPMSGPDRARDASALPVEDSAADFPPSASTLQPDADNQYAPFPLTDIQQAYWIGRHGTGGSDGVATYGYVETDVRRLDMERYEQALNVLIQRHHMLRMVVSDDGTQRFLRDVPFYRIPFQDLSGKSEDERQLQLGQIRETLSHQVLDPGVWPLFQIRVNKIASDVWRIHFGFDFLIVDVLSLLVFFRDLFLVYEGETKRLPPLEINFRDYVLSEKAGKDSALYHKARKYWLDRADTLPAAPMLPYTRSAAQIQSPRYARREFALDADTWGRLKEHARRHRITPSVLIATAYSEVLAQWCKSPKFTVNLTIFNRPRLHPQINDLIGDFTSSVLLEVDQSERSSFEQSARRLQTRLLTDLEHRQFTGVEMLRAMNSSRGGYQTVVMPIVLTSALGLDQYAESRLAGLDAEQLRTYNEMMNPAYAVSQTSQVWLDHVVREKDGVLLCNWDALEELFPPKVLDDMFCAYYDRLIELGNMGDAAWRAEHVSRLPADQETRRRLVNQTEAPVSGELLHELLEKSAHKTPGNVAVIHRDATLSYRDLHVLSTQLGWRLRELGVRPNQLVAVVMHKGWEQIVAVFGVLYSGAAYMPIDAALPKERIHQLLVQGEVRYALTQAQVIGNIDWPRDVSPIAIERQWLDENRRDGAEPMRLPIAQTPTDLAYVLFTSGSTGTPKGVMIDHQSAVNTVLDINTRFGITARDRAIAINALNFDLSVYDVFGLLSAGGAFVMPDHDRALDPSHWAELVVTHGVTFWNTVPAIVQLYVEELEATLEAATAAENPIRYVFMSGDWIPVTLPGRIRRTIRSAQPISLGGPTETTVWSIYHPIGGVAPDWASIPYGKPLANRSHHILHSDMSACPEWVPGEIYTGGTIGLAKGYWKDEGRTNDVFVIHPDTGERLYRTGDWGRFLPDGNIEFLGREDRQVKVQGHRIELGEIEHALRQCDGVQDAVVLAARDESAGAASTNVRLVGYVVEQHFAEDESAINALTSGDVLTDPLEIAAFKLKQSGLRRFTRDAERIALPHSPAASRPLSLYAGDTGAAAASFSGAPTSLDAWSNWLSCLGQIHIDGYALPKYYYPSAGSAYAVQTYLYLGPNSVPLIQEGLYYYNPERHALVCIVNSGNGAALGTVRRFFPRGLADGQFALFFVANTRAIEPLYGAAATARCYLIEAGHIHQLLAARGASCGIGLVPHAGVNAESLVDVLGLDPSYRYIQCLVGGAESDPTRHAGGTEDELTLDCIARQSYRTFARRPVPRENLEALLASCGSARTAATVPSSLCLYVYLKPERVAELPGGFYRYDFERAELIQVARVDTPLQNLQYTRNRGIHRRSAFSILFAGRKAEARDSLLAAGRMAQAAVHLSTHLEIGLCSTGGINQAIVQPHLALSDEIDVHYCLEGGVIDPEQTRTWVTESMQASVEQQWREALQAALPYYMVPGRFVRLASFPLTANGKVDRKALLALAQVTPAKERTQVGPRDTVETELVAVWKKVLEIEQLGVEDNLFELGGDSLAATRLLSETTKVLGVTIPLHALFSNPTVAGLADACRRARAQSGVDHREETSTPSRAQTFALPNQAGDMTAILEADAVLDPDIRPEGTAPPDVARPANILLTGATGFLGAYVLRELLETTEADIHCLARSSKTQPAGKRVAGNMKKYGLWNEAYRDRIVAVEGDLAQAQLVRDAAIYDRLSDQIDVIYHVGAQVNYARSYQDLKKTNVQGAESIIRFACRRRLKAINFVSTKYVCFGLGASGLTIARDEAPVLDPSGMFIGYTQSKWVAERLFAQARERGVPVAIIRPGQITAAMSGDAVPPDDAFHHLVRMFVASASRPNPGEWNSGVIDVVPVDFAARVIARIGTDPTSDGKYFHLVDPNPMPVDRFFDVLERAADDDFEPAGARFAGKPFDVWVEGCRAYIDAMNDPAIAYVLDNFFIKTAHGYSIKGLFAHGDFSTGNVAQVLRRARIEYPRVDEPLWRRYLASLAREEATLPGEVGGYHADRNELRHDIRIGGQPGVVRMGGGATTRS